MTDYDEAYLARIGPSIGEAARLLCVNTPDSAVWRMRLRDAMDSLVAIHQEWLAACQAAGVSPWERKKGVAA